MSNIRTVPEELRVSRSDPAYMAHAYLTKVPVPAILPFIEANSEIGDVVADPFAGSGMTGVAALIAGRRARLSDISVLGQHIGRNYVNLVDPDAARKLADKAVRETARRLGEPYAVPCQRCNQTAQIAKTVWSVVVECSACSAHINYYRSLEAGDWKKPSMACHACGAEVSARLPRVGEEPVAEWITCGCSSVQLEQVPTPAPHLDIDGFDVPDVAIGPDRQMYRASALGKHGLTEIASFYTPRNIAVLTVLRGMIDEVADDHIQSKLLFAFTACLTRASKRYQWSRQRPLNAANANYYVAPVFYEWSVTDLFSRKVEAALRSDAWIRSQLTSIPGCDEGDGITYELESAEKLSCEDESIDYVFTDPPFGSNLFYADMALFQEAWLDGFTNVEDEAVIDRGSTKKRTASRYEHLLTAALSECARVVRPNGRVSMVFGNSSGAVWALVQRSIANAGLEIEPSKLVVLDKGQRSVKGLASGFEHTATLDLILTMRKASNPVAELGHVDHAQVRDLARNVASEAGSTPSHVYLEILRLGFRSHWDLTELDLSMVTAALAADGWTVDPKSGLLRK